MMPRQALSIGINSYSPSHLRLTPCIDDATDVHHALRALGFRSHCATELSLQSMKSLTQKFVRSIQPGAVVMFYFSGHGVQAHGNNYLIPSDATGICADNIKSTAIDAQKLINDMHARHPRVVIFILDCCRTDPPTQPLDGSKYYRPALAGTRPGFAAMRAPPSTIIVYACAADDTASPRSKNGRNSLYTYHLLRYINTPNVDIETVLRYVAADVQRESDNKQVPFRYSSCNEMIYLVGQPQYGGPMSPHGMRVKSLTLYPDSSYRPQRKALIGYPRHPPTSSHFQYHWHDPFAVPFVHHHPSTRSAFPHIRRPSSRYGSPSPRDTWHYRR